MKSFKKMRQLLNDRGIAVILVAGILVTFLLLFMVVGLEFARMYYTRGQLQNAADASALAGAKLLAGSSGDPLTAMIDDSSSAFAQTAARQAAWRFACRNKAAGAPVYLAGEGSGSDCQTPPADLNQASNDPHGDIVVGYWSETAESCDSTGTTEQFCPANGSTKEPINAVKTRPQRASGLEGSARGSVDFLFKGIGNLVGWNKMDIRRQAIASRVPRPTSGITFCRQACPDVNPSLILPNDFYLSVSGSTPTPYGISYTEFNTSSPVGVNTCLHPTSSCNVSSTCGEASNETVAAFIWERKIAPATCGPIRWDNGAATARNDLACAFSSTTFDVDHKTFNAGGTVATWKIMVPITDKCYSGSSPGGGGEDSGNVVGFAEITVDYIVYDTSSTPKGLHVTDIKCKACDDHSSMGKVATLVR